jgi:hypothetical protein
MRRQALLGVLVVLAAAGCGGAPVVEQEPAPTPAQRPAAPAVGSEPTAEELAFRKQLLADLEDGSYVPCTCTSDVRAKERVASGRATTASPARAAGSTSAPRR